MGPEGKLPSTLIRCTLITMYQYVVGAAAGYVLGTKKIDPEPRMREVKDLRRGKKLRGGSDKQIEDTIYEPDQD